MNGTSRQTSWMKLTLPAEVTVSSCRTADPAAETHGGTGDPEGGADCDLLRVATLNAEMLPVSRRLPLEFGRSFCSGDRRSEGNRPPPGYWV